MIINTASATQEIKTNGQGKEEGRQVLTIDSRRLDTRRIRLAVLESIQAADLKTND